MLGEMIALIGQFVIAGLIIGFVGVLVYAVLNTNNQDDPSPKWKDIKNDVLKTKPKYSFDIFQIGKKKS